jgi:translation initiation factor IF-2
MDKIKILEIAAEAGVSNSELLEKAKELGFSVKAANSAISVDEAGILVDYALTGKLPAGFNEDKPKVKKTTIKKKPKAKVESTEDTTPKTKEETESTEETALKSQEEPEATPEPEVSTPIEEKKEPKKRKGISVVAKKTQETTIKKADDESRAKRPLSRGGIKIVKKAKPTPMKAAKKISMGNAATPPPKKKIKKGPAQAKESGTKIDIFNYEGMSGEIDSGFGEEEVVLLDFSDKNIYEEMMRQEQKRKEEAKRRESSGTSAKGKQTFRPQHSRSL